MIKEKLLGLKNKVDFKVVAVTTTALASVPTFASSGNSDLGTISDAMTDFLTSLKTYGVAIVVAVIAFALIFVGARWLWGMFRQWLAGAK